MVNSFIITLMKYLIKQSIYIFQRYIIEIIPIIEEFVLFLNIIFCILIHRTKEKINIKESMVIFYIRDKIAIIFSITMK